MTRATRSMVERGEEHVDGSVVRQASQDRQAALQVADIADRHNAADAIPLVLDALGINWPAIRDAQPDTTTTPKGGTR